MDFVARNPRRKATPYLRLFAGALDQILYSAPMPIPVISVAQMREWEKAAWAGGQTLFTRGFEAAARAIERLLQDRS